MLISADSPGDLWVDELPASLKQKAPRATRNPDNLHWYFASPGTERGVDLTLSGSAGLSNEEVDALLSEDPDAIIGSGGGSKPVPRLLDLWNDDTVVDILYPTAGLALLQLEDQALGEACYSICNDWLADFCATDPVRLLGHALVPAWDIGVGVAELRRAHDLGLRGGLIWTSPPIGDSFIDRRYDPLWAAASEMHMPMAIRTLAGQRESRDIANFDSSVESSYYFTFRTHDEMQRSVSEMIVAGVFERFPELKMVGAEGGINYAAVMEQRLDSGYGGFWGKLGHGLTMKPSEYFRRNVLLTYINDPIGLNNLSFTGADHFMWSGDYPHGASTWPNSRASVASECAAAGIDDATLEKLTVTNAAEAYRIDVAEVQAPSPAIVDQLSANG